jgi:2-dehydropantoate 2-reductase
MKIGIIGAGSIGLLFAAYLNKSNEITLYTRTPEQAAEINNHGIVLNKAGARTIFQVKALPLTSWRGTETFAIIAVKQYQLPAVLEHLTNLPEMPQNLLFLQNGMGHLKLLESLTSANLFVGSIEHGALKENGYTVSHNGQGITNVAVYKGDPAVLYPLIASAPLDFPFLVKPNYYEMLLDKLVINAVINPLTSILGVKNGALIENQFYFHVLMRLFAEISSILNLREQDKHLQQVISICKNTAGNRSSMLKDIEANRMTEADAILGFILDEAKKLEKAAPLTESLYFAIKGKEQAGRSLSS